MLDPKAVLREDRWERPSGKDSPSSPGSRGITAVYEDGIVLEKAAANVSIISGTLTPTRAQSMSSRGRASIDPNGGQAYRAAAMSLVFHSANPLIPTLRGDVRLFQVEDEMWLGGGIDLTPNYLIEDDFRGFHQHVKLICDKHDAGLYEKAKADCDDYFCIPCRAEHRGIGGLFFDDLSCDSAFDPIEFTKDVGLGMISSWAPIVERRRHEVFTEAQRDWQLIRRGRYLEFNLLYDRGVKFGLDGPGRIESIMVSAPPLIRWKYNAEPLEGSEEAEMMKVLRKPRDWIA